MVRRPIPVVVRLVLGLVAMMLVALLAACGGKEANTPTAPAATKPAATAAAAATAPAATKPASTVAPATTAPAATAAPSAKIPGLTPPPAGRVQRILDSPTAKLWPQKVRDWVQKYHSDNFKPIDPYKPVKGGIVVTNEGWADPPSWDTTKAQQFSTIFNTTYIARNLITWQQQYGSDSASYPPTPDLAESWESSGDGTVWTFKLIKGLMWPDTPPTMKSREMTAEDVKYAMDIYMFQSIFKGEWTDMDRIEVPDKYTVKFISKKPIPNFPSGIASYHMPLFPKEWYECTDDCKLKYFIGIGPFTIKERVKDVRTVFVRNPNYLRKDPVNGEQLPYIDEIDKVSIPDIAAQIAAARTGKVDTMDIQSWRGQFFDFLKTNPDIIIGIATSPDKWFSGGSRIYFPLDQAPWNDKRVRQAISMSINRQKIIHEIYEDMQAMPSAVPYVEWRDFSPMVNEEMLGAGRYDPAKAKQLLKDAGFEKGLKLELDISFAFATAAQVTANQWLLMQQMMKEVGIDLQWTSPPDVRTHAIKVLTFQKSSRPYEYAVAPVGSRMDLWISNTYKCKGQANYGQLCDPDMDKLVDKVSALPRPSTERAAAAKQVEEWFWENVPWVPINETWRLGWRQPWILNVTTTSDTTQFYAGAGADKAWIDCAAAQKYNMPAERRPAACK